MTGCSAIRRLQPAPVTEPTISRLTYTLTSWDTLHPYRVREVSARAIAMALGYAALANLGVRHLSEPYREEVMRATGGAVAVGGPRPSQHDLFRPEPERLAPACNSTSAHGADRQPQRWGVPIFGHCHPTTGRFIRELRDHYGSRWPRCATASSVPADGGEVRIHHVHRRLAG